MMAGQDNLGFFLCLTICYISNVSSLVLMCSAWSWPEASSHRDTWCTWVESYKRALLWTTTKLKGPVCCIVQYGFLLLGCFGADFKNLLRMFGVFITPFGVRRGFKVILSHKAPSSLNVSSYRAIWTRFRPNSMIFINLIFQLLASGTGSR